MKPHHSKQTQAPISPWSPSPQTAGQLQPFAFRTSCRRLLAFYSGILRTEQEMPERRLRRKAANAARRGDQGARDFLTDLLHEQAA
jgi:hypothetical protein